MRRGGFAEGEEAQAAQQERFLDCWFSRETQVLLQAAEAKFKKGE